MKISYSTLSKNYYSYDETSANYKNTADFYKELGINLDDLLAQSDGYANTCAARVSLALIKSGVSFSGRLPIKSGPHVGKKARDRCQVIGGPIDEAGITRTT